MKRTSTLGIISIALILPSFSAALAQSQAPITWEAPRFVPLRYHLGGGGLPMVPMGDTLIFMDYVEHNRPTRDELRVAHSWDNGTTCSAWRLCDTTVWSFDYLQIAGAAGGAYIVAMRSVFDWYPLFWRSSIGGDSWTPRMQLPISGTHLALWASGDAVYRVVGEASGTCLRYSTNRGTSWQPVETIDTSFVQVPYAGFARTQDHMVVVALGELAALPEDRQLWFAQRDSLLPVWLPRQLLPDQPYQGGAVWNAAIAGDPASNIVMVASIWGELYDADLWLTRSTDAGEHWQNPVWLSDMQTARRPLVAWYEPRLFSQGRLWAVAWPNRHPSGPEDQGMYVRFSANGGKNWYIAQRADTLREGVGPFVMGQFVGREIRLYWVTEDTTAPPFLHYRTVTGIFTPDTIPPDLTADFLIPDSALVGQAVTVGTTAWDNDTLSEARFAVRDSTERIERIMLPYAEDSHYRGQWTIPHAGHFRYRYEAEDFWENVTAYPDSGWLSFLAEPRSHADDPSILHPSSFILSVFPNPCNGWPHVRLSPDWFSKGPATITVYNVLGQKMLETRLSSATMLSALDAPAATGLYLLEVSSATHHERQKFLVLK